MLEKIRAAGGEVYAITSEPQRLANDAKREWELGFETIGDPHHEIPEQCEERGWLTLYVNEKVASFENKDSNLSHPKGYFQPGVLSLNSNQRVLYRWRSIPTRKNIGGAVERPTAKHVFEQVSQALTLPNETEDSQLDAQPELDSKGRPWPLFIFLLLANGWFIRPRTFLLTNSKIPVPQRFRNALFRIPFFIAAWLAAFVMLPSLWVGLVAIMYGLWLTPQIVKFNAQSQNIRLAED